MTRFPRICALLLVLAVPTALAGCGDSSDDDDTASTTTAAGPQLSTAFGSMDDLPGILETPPPWPANDAKLQLRLRAIGLPALQTEGEALHTHQHLELFVDGKPVPVPSDIGIGPESAFISPLHTHDTPPNTMHVESPTTGLYSLGQFFAVWGVRLDARCIGSKCAGSGRQLRTWVNGKPVAGDPTRIVLAEAQVIVLAFGSPSQVPKKVPATLEEVGA